MKLLIAPSILAADIGNLRDEIRRLDGCGVDAIHIDVMDGTFVKNITFGPGTVSSIRSATDLPFELHLMVERPDLWIRDFADAGADLITVHSEAKHNMRRTLDSIRSCKAKIGIAINPHTGLSNVVEFLNDIDQLLIMSVNPGFGGQQFMRNSLRKIKDARNYVKKDDCKAIIAVDGGINLETGREALSAGAQELIAGTAIFKSSDMAHAVRKFRLLEPHVAL